jgi:hypothetical protein
MEVKTGDIYRYKGKRYVVIEVSGEKVVALCENGATLEISKGRLLKLLDKEKKQ